MEETMNDKETVIDKETEVTVNGKETEEERDVT